jgi:MFS family permease
MMTSNSPSKYKWYILGLGIATHMLVVAVPLMCMPVLFKEISEDLNLSLVQVGVVWGVASLPSLFAAFFAGLVSDKYGSTRTLGVACLLQAIAGTLRGISGDFTSLAVYMFLFGFFSIPLSFATHKAAGEWFSGRQLGLANGILAMGMGVGNMVGSMVSATVLSPLFGGWRHLMFVYGAVAIVISLLWLKAKRHPGRGGAAQSIEAVPFRQALSHVVRLRVVWLLALVVMCLSGYIYGLNGYLPLYLRGAGWTNVGADGALAALCAASVVGVVPLSLLSDRIGLRKVIMYPAFFVIIIGVSLLAAFSGPIVWLAVILVGFVQEAFFALSITMIMEAKEVGAAYAGTALGLSTTLVGLGGFFGPPIGNRLAEVNPGFAFIFWLALVAVALLIFYFVEETGWKKGGLYPEGDIPDR